MVNYDDLVWIEGRNPADIICGSGPDGYGYCRGLYDAEMSSGIIWHGGMYTNSSITNKPSYILAVYDLCWFIEREGLEFDEFSYTVYEMEGNKLPDEIKQQVLMNIHRFKDAKLLINDKELAELVKSTTPFLFGKGFTQTGLSISNHNHIFRF